jgi:hypothetical protein
VEKPFKRDCDEHYLGVFILRHLAIPPAQLLRNVPAHLARAVLDESLDDTAGVVLEHDVDDVAAECGGERADVVLLLGVGVLLPREGPEAFYGGEEGGVGFGGAALGVEGFLGLVGCAGGF